VIEYIGRDGPPEAMNCPAFICDVCNQQVVKHGNVMWGTTVGHDPADQPHRQTRPYITHKDVCVRAFEAWFKRAYPGPDWLLLSDEINTFLQQLAHNFAHAFADDTEGTYLRHRVQTAEETS